MENNGWRYYNHALIPCTAPHETPDVAMLDQKAVWRTPGGRVLLARWTTDFDCGHETNWWYCICDRPFEIQSLKSKRRNVVANGEKYCRVLIADPMQYEEELLELYNAAQNTYAPTNRNLSDRDSFHRFLKKLSENPAVDFYISFLRETNRAAGYAVVENKDGYAEFQAQKVHPQLERYQVNASLVKAIADHYADRLGSGFYICDGARNINHKTNFQDYLEKYFGFRKAYCRLHVRYRGALKAVMPLLYALRAPLKKLDGVKLIHQINGVLLMEEYRRQADE